jgi:hypothetical protein
MKLIFLFIPALFTGKCCSLDCIWSESVWAGIYLKGSFFKRRIYWANNHKRNAPNLPLDHCVSQKWFNAPNDFNPTFFNTCVTLYTFVTSAYSAKYIWSISPQIRQNVVAWSIFSVRACGPVSIWKDSFETTHLLIEPHLLRLLCVFLKKTAFLVRSWEIGN